MVPYVTIVMAFKLLVGDICTVWHMAKRTYAFGYRYVQFWESELFDEF